MMRQRIAGGLVLCVLGGAAFAAAEESPGFRHTFSLGVSLTEGNSETLLVNTSFLSEGEKEGLGSVRAGLEANYGESRVDVDDGARAKETTVENARVFANARKTITPRTFASLDGSLLYDDIARIDYRAAVSPGVGVYLLRSRRISLSVESGPAYIWEKVDDQSADYFALRVAERFTLDLSETARIWQSAEYTPKADAFSDYLLDAELGAEADMTVRTSLRVVLKNRYDSTPAEGLEKNDLSLVAAIGMTF